jgi:hypothetical protein
MKHPLKSFPFKNMLDMVEAVIKRPDGADISLIARDGHSCYIDTNEVTAMASFLGNLGKVERNRKGWFKISNPNPRNIQPRFRSDYIEDVERIVRILTPDAKISSEVANEAGIDKALTEDYLLFLEELTKHGYIYHDLKERKLKLEPWS